MGSLRHKVYIIGGMMSRKHRIRPPSVKMTYYEGVVKRVSIAVNSKTWEYDIDYSNNTLIIYVGENDFEYDLPDWVTIDSAIFDDINGIIIEQEF